MDILRDRERGVPRYNQFRRLLHKAPVKSFDELTDNPAWRKQIKEVYNGDLEKVDLMTGLFAEPLPDGLRLQRDRVPHLHPDGVAAAEERSLLHRRLPARRSTRSSASTTSARTRCCSVLRRHYPQLAPALAGRRERVRAVEAGERAARRVRWNRGPVSG